MKRSTTRKAAGTLVLNSRLLLSPLSVSLCAMLLALLPLNATQRIVLGQPPSEEYPTPAESQKQEGVPEGKIEGPFSLTSTIYPGTVRDYWIYVPAQYDAEKPACSLIVQDGLNRAKGWKLPQVCDNLIHSQEMPVTIGIFVNPGVVPTDREGGQPRFNRSFEYDSMGDRYARFLLEELIPEVSKTYSLSPDPNDRALAGASSGGICAFNAAWERPDAFRRVISTIGTFVGLRGGNEFSMLVRKMEPKPIRVFMQDGSNDLDIYAGDWWTANQDMLSALQWSGYDVKHVWGEGGHNGKHGAAIMPEALRWLWRDYPEPIKAAPNLKSKRRVDLLVEGEGWQEVSSGHELAEAPTCNASGELFFSDSKAGRIYRVGDDNKTRIFADQTGAISGLSFGPDGVLYGIKDGKQIVSFDNAGAATVVLDNITARCLTVMPTGFYWSDPSTPAIFWSSFENVSTKALPLLEPVIAMAPTVDHAFMHLASSNSRYTLHCQIAANGVLQHRQEYGYLHIPYHSQSSAASGIALDREGRYYVSSGLGIQVLDQLGRVNLILAAPNKNAINGIAFGGAGQQSLFVTCGSSVYRRKINTQGATSFQDPIAPPKPGL